MATSSEAHFSKINWIATALALACLVGALFLHIEYDKSLDRLTADQLKTEFQKNPIFSWYFLSNLLKEIAFALIIAIFIGIGIERAAKYQQVAEVKGYLDQVRDNVFDAVLKKQFPETIVAKVHDTIFSTKTIRKSSNMTIKLKDFPADCSEGEGFLIYEVIHHYVIKNLTSNEVEHPLKLFGPAPRKPHLRKYLPKMSISVENVPLTSDEMHEGTNSIEDDGFEERFSKTLKIPPKKAITIRTSLALAKLAEDMEMWVSLLPQEGIDLTIEIDSKKKLHWDIDSYFFGKMSSTTPDLLKPPFCENRGTFTTKDVIFPYQGINFSWRPEPEKCGDAKK